VGGFAPPISFAKRVALLRSGECRRGEKGCLESVVYPGGTEGSNPLPSSGESLEPVWHGISGAEGRPAGSLSVCRRRADGAAWDCNPRRRSLKVDQMLARIE